MHSNQSTAAHFVGRIGALAVALGVGAVIGGNGIAAADSDTGSDSVSTPRQTAERGHPGVRRSAGVTRAASQAKNRRDARVSPPAAAKSPAGLIRVETDAPTPVPAAAPAAARVPTAPVLASAATAATSTATVVTVAQPARTAVATAAPAAGTMKALLVPRSGLGTGSPLQSQMSWTMLAVARRFNTGRALTARPRTVNAAATTGTTTPITWAWGTNPVLAFNTATDKLDFGWMGGSAFDVTETSGSTQIAIVGNNQSYTLKGVPLSQLTMTNIIAKDAGAASKWQGLIAGAQTAAPTVSIAGTTVAEGNSGTSSAAFTVTLSKASSSTVTVGYSTADGTAIAGQDYAATSGTLTFAPGVTSQQVSVAVTGDTTVEPDETFTVTLATPSGATIATGSATGTIVSDDTGGSTPGGTTTPVQGGTTTVIAWRWGTDTVLAFDTAKDKLDFGWFQPGNFEIGETADSTRITIVGNNQTYTLSGVKLASMSLGNIAALDAGTTAKWQSALTAAGQTSTVVTPPTVSVTNASVAEGNSGTSELAFTVSLSKASTTPVSVNYTTANGTATAGQDYTATSGTVTFAPGVLSQQIKVAVTGDTTVEAGETLTVTLSNPTGATLATATATGTITNDDSDPVAVNPPTVSVANATVAEGNSGTSELAFTVSLSKASTTPVSVNYTTANGTATAGQDYTATSGTVTFAPGVLSQQIKVAVTGDTTVEAGETLTVTLSNPAGATLATATATGTITNDDSASVPQPATALPIATTDKVLAVYFPEWGIYGRDFQVADIPGEQVNRVIYSFLNLTSSGEVAIYDSFAAVEKRFAAADTVSGEADQWYYPADDPRSTQTVWGNFNQLAELKAKYPHMRVSIAVGGWTLSGNFSTVASTAAGREKLADSIVSFLTTYQMFDGVDFDWEYPGGGGLEGNSQSPDDGANYAELLKVVRAKLDVLEQQTGRTYDISVASPAGYDKIANFNLAGLAPSVDFFNVMAYDFHGTWETSTGHQSAFTGDPNGYDVETAVGLYLAAGVDPGKIVLGAPLYTRGWSGVADGGDGGYLEKASGAAPGTFEAGVYDYKDLLAQLKDPASGWKLYWDDTAQAAYLYNAAQGLFSSFETPTSIAQKSDWAQALGLGGMMFWDITNDAVGSPDSLVKAAYESWVLGQTMAAVRDGAQLPNELIVGGDGVIGALPSGTTL